MGQHCFYHLTPRGRSEIHFWPNCTFLACVCGYTVKNEKLDNLLGSHIRPCQCLCGLKFIITQWANIVFIISHNAGGQKCTFGQTELFSLSVSGYTVKNQKLDNLLGSHIRPCQCLCGLKFIITQWANIVFIISHHAGGQKRTFGQTALSVSGYLSVSCYTVKNEKLNNLLGQPYPTMPMLVWSYDHHNTVGQHCFYHLTQRGRSEMHFWPNCTFLACL